jgi:hypothetical protein
VLMAAGVVVSEVVLAVVGARGVMMEESETEAEGPAAVPTATPG